MVTANRYLTDIAQVEWEFGQFVQILKDENVRSYLEIGSQYGGSLWRAARALPKGSRVVSVDLPWDRNTHPHLMACVEALLAEGYDAHSIIGDSRSETVVELVRELGPFDAAFIDANHTLPYVISDWQNYGPMARIVAFHDIAWDRPVREGRLPIEVAKLWRHIRAIASPTVEIVANGSEKGIGIVWRSSAPHGSGAMPTPSTM